MPKRISSLAEKCEVCVFSIPRGLNDAFELAVDWNNPPSVTVSQKHKIIRDFMRKFIAKKSKETKIDFYNKALDFFTSKGEILNKSEQREKIKKFKSSFFLILLLIFILPSVYASGLIFNPNSFLINKTVGQNPVLYTQLINTENYDFVNITLDNNIYTQMEKIPILHPGESRNVSITITSNSTIISTFDVYGFFFRDIGQSFVNYSINLTSVNPPYLEPCNLIITKGDRVFWTNSLLFDSVAMSTSNYQIIEGSLISPGQTYFRQFNVVEELSYYWVRYSIPFTPLCKVTVLDSVGYVRDPTKDAYLNLNIAVSSLPTTVNLTVTPLFFSTSITSAQEGTLIVRNTGSLRASGIHLSGEWTSFSANDFDLEPTQSKGIVFTVLPFVFNTSSTNKTYTKKIQVTGNFPTQEQDIQIYVAYASIDSGENISDVDYLINIFCPKYPHSSLCEQDPRVEYRYVYNLSNQGVNVSITQKRLDDLWAYIFDLGDQIKTYRNYDKERFDLVSINVNSTTSDIALLREKMLIMEENRKSSITYLIYFLTITFVVFSCLIAGALIYIYRHKKQLEELRRWN